jgi:pyruvate formate-lyase/glycerol dehydratase family glycyl radical enzyme
MEITETKKARGIPSQRANRLKAQLRKSGFKVDVERVRAYTKIWREMGPRGDQTPYMRSALALQETLRNIGIFIAEEERLVGTRGPSLRAETMGVERNNCFGSYDLATIVLEPRAEKNRAACPVRSELEEELFPFWEGRSLIHVILRRLLKEGIIKGSLLMGPVDTHRLVRGIGGPEALKALSRKLNKSFQGLIEFAKLNEPLVRNQAGVGASSGVGSIRYWLRIARNLIRLGISSNRYGKVMFPEGLWLQLPMQGHVVPGLPRVLEMGFEGIANRAKQELQKLEEGEKDYRRRRDFLESVVVVADAVCDYALRYARLARRQAEEAESEERRVELKEVAERCEKVPAKPPETFMEALQSILLAHNALIISYGADNIFSPGRVDQYLFPYYRRDVESGSLTRERVLEALEEYFIKMASISIFGPNQITIGGLDKEGKDATNEVSFIFLEALENIRGFGCGLAVRISHNTPREFLLRACAVHQYTAGVAFFNDDIIIRDLMEDGYSLEDARNYSLVGCVEPAGTGDSYSPTALNGIWLTGVLELALGQGKRLITGSRRLGVPTPDPRQFKSFEELKDAFERQLSFVIERAVCMKEMIDHEIADRVPNPLLSSTIEGCLESGYDATRGGARYNHGCVNAQGLGTVADSLAAINWAVFEEKIVTMEELLEAISMNFKGYENLRMTLMRKAPKYGNDDPRADDIAAWISQVFARECGKYTSWRGGRYRCSMVSSATQLLEGYFCGATPDGRLALEPISNSMSPSNGMERSGLTATLRSAALAGDANYSDGSALNVRVNPSTLRSYESLEKFATLLEAYFVMGGRHVQFTPLDTETLHDAQTHPEKYPDLTVKVSGYSARFVELIKSLQDDIIARAELDGF